MTKQESTNHFLLIKREGLTPAGEILPAREAALTLLNAGIWPLWKNTRNRNAIRSGDQVAVYLSGPNNQSIVATARVREVGGWDRSTSRSYPLIPDGEPVAVLYLSHRVIFAQPKPVKPRLERLSFYHGGSK